MFMHNIWLHISIQHNVDITSLITNSTII